MSQPQIQIQPQTIQQSNSQSQILNKIHLQQKLQQLQAAQNSSTVLSQNTNSNMNNNTSNNNLSQTANQNNQPQQQQQQTNTALQAQNQNNSQSQTQIQAQQQQQQQQRQQQQQQQQQRPHHHHEKLSSKYASSNIVATHYKVNKKIGEGSFGVIYEGVNLLNNAMVAIKFEHRNCDAPQLREEHRSYKILSGIVGVPKAYYFGQQGKYNILCMDLLGPSLEDMFDLCKRKFSVKTVCMVAKQMITRVESMHERNLIHRDIKPDNFLIGRLPRTLTALLSNRSDTHFLDKNFNIKKYSVVRNHTATHPHPASQVYMVDFGMAKQYRDPRTKRHIPYRDKKSLSGTARYMSINTHLGIEQSRRDDLEALGHVFMYFLRGSLPWQGLKAATNKQKYERICEKKQTTTLDELCGNFPNEFKIYMNYVRNLKFDEQPDYEYLRNLLNKVLSRMGEIDDGVFDWMIVMDKKIEERLKREMELERMRSQQNSLNSQNSSTVNVEERHRSQQRISDMYNLKAAAAAMNMNNQYSTLNVPRMNNTNISNAAVNGGSHTNLNSMNIMANTSTTLSNINGMNANNSNNNTNINNSMSNINTSGIAVGHSSAMNRNSNINSMNMLQTPNLSNSQNASAHLNTSSSNLNNAALLAATNSNGAGMSNNNINNNTNNNSQQQQQQQQKNNNSIHNLHNMSQSNIMISNEKLQQSNAAVVAAQQQQQHLTPPPSQINNMSMTMNMNTSFHSSVDEAMLQQQQQQQMMMKKSQQQGQLQLQPTSSSNNQLASLTAVGQNSSNPHSQQQQTQPQQLHLSTSQQQLHQPQSQLQLQASSNQIGSGNNNGDKQSSVFGSTIDYRSQQQQQQQQNGGDSGNGHQSQSYIVTPGPHDFTGFSPNYSLSTFNAKPSQNNTTNASKINNYDMTDNVAVQAAATQNAANNISKNRQDSSSGDNNNGNTNTKHRNNKRSIFSRIFGFGCCIRNSNEERENGGQEI